MLPRADACTAPSTSSPGGPSAFFRAVFSSATDDMDDCESRGLLPSVLSPDEDVVVAVGEGTEIEAA